MSSSLTALKVLTIITSVTLRISPSTDFYGIYKRKATGDVQLLPVVALFVNCAALVMYAYVISDYVPLFTTNMFGVCTSIGFIVVFYIYSSDRKYFFKTCAYGLAITIIFLLYTVLAAAGVTGETKDDEGTVLGWITLFTTLSQFVAPLATLKRVIATKSSATLPFFLCLMNTVNGSLWMAYSAVKWNVYIFAPNVVGVALGTSQVILWFVYRPRRSDKAKPTLLVSSGALPSDSVVIEMSQSQRSTLEHIPSFISTGGSSFVAMASPVQQEC
jgi:solute carrier family 50 protein (sugar transporter)